MTPRILRLIVGALATLLVVLTGAQPASASPATDYANAAFRATNERRVNHDLVKLSRGDCLQTYARRQAIRMANQQRMFHQDLGVVLNKCNLTRVGENVAAGFPTGKAAVRGWMNSDGHRANILEGRYKLLGLAARRGDNGVVYAVQVFGRR